MNNATSPTRDRRQSASESFRRSRDSSRVVGPTLIVDQRRATARTSSKASPRTTQTPDPRSHAGQRRSRINGASPDSATGAVAVSMGTRAAEPAPRVIGIVTTTTLLELPAGASWPCGDPTEDQETWLAS